jgi:hypothetical protein
MQPFHVEENVSLVPIRWATPQLFLAPGLKCSPIPVLQLVLLTTWVFAANHEGIFYEFVYEILEDIIACSEVSDSYLVRSLRIDGNQRFEMLFQDRDNATTGLRSG